MIHPVEHLNGTMRSVSAAVFVTGISRDATTSQEDSLGTKAKYES